MEMLWKVLIGIIALPLLLAGLNIIVQIMIGSGAGLLTLFTSIWDKDTKLSAQEGLVVGVGYVLAQRFVVFIFAFVFGLAGVGSSFVDGLSSFLSLIPIFVLLVAIIRKKFLFGISFFVTTQLLYAIIVSFF